MVAVDVSAGGQPGGSPRKFELVELGRAKVQIHGSRGRRRLFRVIDTAGQVCFGGFYLSLETCADRQGGF